MKTMLSTTDLIEGHVLCFSLIVLIERYENDFVLPVLEFVAS